MGYSRKAPAFGASNFRHRYRIVPHHPKARVDSDTPLAPIGQDDPVPRSTGTCASGDVLGPAFKTGVCHAPGQRLSKLRMAQASLSTAARGNGGPSQFRRHHYVDSLDLKNRSGQQDLERYSHTSFIRNTAPWCSIATLRKSMRTGSLTCAPFRPDSINQVHPLSEVAYVPGIRLTLDLDAVIKR